ncbi:MAG: hypothetical protein WDN28_13160 [Chthoniobacter sp.]
MTFANPVGGGGSGALTKTGGGSLQINSSINTSGPVNVINGSLILANTTTPNVAIARAVSSSADLWRSRPPRPTIWSSSTADEQIDDNAPIFIDGVIGSISAQLNLNGHKETVGALTIAGSTATAGFVSGITTGANGVLVLNGDLNLINTRGATGNSGREVLITTSGFTTTANFTGTGKLDLGGVMRNITVTSPNLAANLPGSDATIETIVQDGGINKYGGRTLYLGNSNTYELATNIYEGVLAIGTATGLGVGDGTLATGTTVYDGGTLQLGFAQAGVTDANFTVANELLHINGQGGALNAGALDNKTGTNTWSTAVIMDSDARVNADAGTLFLTNGLVTAGGASMNLSVGGLGTAQASGTVVISVPLDLHGGSLLKDGSSTLVLTSGADNISSVTINGSATNTIASVLASVARTGTPFGSGPITVNPGGVLRPADASNISGNAVTLNSDTNGLAGLGMGYNGPVPTILTSGTAAPGQIEAHANANGIGGALNLDVPNFTYSLDMSTIGNGRMFLGSSIGSGSGATASSIATYFAPTLLAGLPDVGDATNTPLYRLGAGGRPPSSSSVAAHLKMSSQPPGRTSSSPGEHPGRPQRLMMPTAASSRSTRGT